MKKMFLFLVLIIMATSVIIGSLMPVNAAINTPWLHVDGKYFKDPAGNVVILRGVSLIELELTDEGRPGIPWMVDMLTNEANGWYARVIRLPVLPNTVWYLGDPAEYVSNHLIPAVEYCASKGIYCIVDWHPIDDPYALDAATREFWTRVAPLFKDYPNVIYEVYNECSTSISWSSWKSVAQPWVDLIRSYAPNNIILIGGPQWCQLMSGAVGNPFNGTNLAYVGHIYPQIGQDWESNWGVVADYYPMFITEWGYHLGAPMPCSGTESGFGNPLKSFIEAHGMSWIAWCADYAWEPTMFDTNWNLLSDENHMGGFAKDWLYEKRNSNLPGPVPTPAAVTAKQVAGGMTVDGNLSESAWNITTGVTKTISGSPNNTVTYGVLWDASYLYVGFKVIDASLNNDSTNMWDDDTVEVFVDANHNHGASYDTYDRQYLKGWNDSALWEKNNNTTGVLHAWTAVTGGYSVEMAIPWSNLGITGAAGTTIGFDAGMDDDDDSGVRDSQLLWSGTTNNWTDTSAFGNCYLSAEIAVPTPTATATITPTATVTPSVVASPSSGNVTAKKTINSLTVDGNLNESVWTIGTTVTKTITGTPNNTVTYGVLWDASYLYVGFKVIDSSLKNDSTNVWDDDAVEIFIDANHNHGTSYDTYDRQYLKGWNDSALWERNNNTTGVLHAWAAVTGGYSVEMAIPWSNFGITGAAGTTIGFDAGMDDDDDGGARDSQLLWNGTNNNWTDTSVFGNCYLSSETVGTVTPTATPTATITPSTAPALVVYNDATTWEDWSWGVITNYNNSSPVYAGTKSISVDFTNAYASLSLYKSTIPSMSGYTKLQFYAHGGSSGTRQITVFLFNESGVEGPHVNVDIAAGSWSLESISLSSLGSPAAVQRVSWQDRTDVEQPVFYLDEIKFVP